MTEVKITCSDWYPFYCLVDLNTYTGLIDTIVDIPDEKIKEMEEIFDKMNEIQDYLCEMTPDD